MQCTKTLFAKYVLATYLALFAILDANENRNNSYLIFLFVARYGSALCATRNLFILYYVYI